MYAQVEKPKENKSRTVANSIAKKKGNGKGVVQKTRYNDLDGLLDSTPFTLNRDKLSNVVKSHLSEAQEFMQYVDFKHSDEAQMEIDPNIIRQDGLITVNYDKDNAKGLEEDVYVGQLIHELIHVANRKRYKPNNARMDDTYINLNISPHDGNSRIKKDRNNEYYGWNGTQISDHKKQTLTLKNNIEELGNALEWDKDEMSEDQYRHILYRLGYASSKPHLEYDTVLFDIAYYMEKQNLKDTNMYEDVIQLLTEAQDRRQKGGAATERTKA
ncbi:MULTISPECIES: hypothetical protein [Vibrio]|uniref:hypothetical protein n=1 Tax=Vibrio TaxID=662 RepID=UPI000505BC68|nr:MULTISPECIES: hypothetical protein [Vibrio]KFI10736.1 hypothetical protein IX95_17990 [Vibrio sp. B183]NOI20022.1 hypothetical protein [Vibrio coralliilyticus]